MIENYNVQNLLSIEYIKNESYLNIDKGMGIKNLANKEYANKIKCLKAEKFNIRHNKKSIRMNLNKINQLEDNTQIDSNYIINLGKSRCYSTLSNNSLNQFENFEYCRFIDSSNNLTYMKNSTDNCISYSSSTSLPSICIVKNGGPNNNKYNSLV
ncbi:hypothetical protein ACR3K2_37170 [Cryptosporidium serpentis]